MGSPGNIGAEGPCPTGQKGEKGNKGPKGVDGPSGPPGRHGISISDQIYYERYKARVSKQHTFPFRII